jgi:dehydrodolichyl diphosphate syntase complex subunit NUS1
MLHLLLHFILSTIFGIYIRARKLYHALFDRLSAVLNYHHRTPERMHSHC